MTDRLTGIEARLNAATPGQWFANRYYVGAGEDPTDPDAEIAKASFKPDAEFIAAAPTDMAALLNAVNAALELHRSVQVFFPDYVDGYYECDQCMEAYPCPTVTAINAALEGK
jgi:hypothetical protein